MTAPARVAAFRALREVTRGDAQPAAVLAREHRGLADPRDRALTTEIVTGTLRWQRALDGAIARTAARSLDTVHADLLLILRLSLYQLLHLDRVPASAVVDDAVSLARTAGQARATGFVNGVLRTLSRTRDRLGLPPRPADGASRQAALDYLGITQSHPDWLVARWLDRYGFEPTAAWTEFNNSIPALTLRANRLVTSRDALRQELLAEDDLVTTPGRYAPDALVVQGGRLPEARGRFTIQDEASQLVPLLLGARPGERVLDLCASPGGKATALAAEMDGRGLIVACDARPRRMRLLAATVRDSRAPNVRLVQVGSRDEVPFSPVFDKVIVDAPCSGLGTVRRDPDIRWRRTETELATFAAYQQTLLARAARTVAPGGRLVYATCSSEPEENEAVVDAFLAAHSGFRLADAREIDDARLGPVTDPRGMLRTLPFAHGLEAFFAAALVRLG
ncbi:MAG TPA: 16S rRNA (cytosine(967)-C(5))-methyltransferase RsmB [Vicinamibacterales bacterium]|jgi:16S rRNA (cytosine967-C5)-methyltransferase|nr:16S rRNA (cytosine(967)-C(5))-methyltransferase RsmB [Vicinamibacterales bacterium]